MTPSDITILDGMHTHAWPHNAIKGRYTGQSALLGEWKLKDK